jgi:hypothetical protein
VLTPIAYGLAIALDLFVIVIGARFLLAPQPAAAAYGVPAVPHGDAAYLTIKGLRDATFGIMLVVALAPLGDTLIVLRHGGTKATAFGIHLATAAIVLATAALLFAV